MFECPNCNGGYVTEVMAGRVQFTRIMEYDDDGKPIYGDFSVEGGEISHFECSDCGHIMTDRNDNYITDISDILS